MTKHSLVMTPTSCRVVECIISIRPMYPCARALTLLHKWLGRIKPAISPKRLEIERKLLLTAYINLYTGFRFPPKSMTLNNVWARFKVIDTLNEAKIAKYSLEMTPMPRRRTGLEELSLLVLRIHAPVHLLTYLLTQNNQCFGDWPVI